MGEDARPVPQNFSVGGRADEGNMQNQFITIARKLRKNQTPQEGKLWAFLKDRRLKNVKFRRQHPIGNYIVDFFCEEKRLIIEVDGGQHNEQIHYEKDQIRDKFLKNQGYIIVRFWNNDIDENLDGVLNRIIEQLDN